MVTQQQSAAPVVLTPHRFSSDDYLRMIEDGILGPEDKVELINGEVVEMSPSGAKHAGIVTRLNRMFSDLWNQAEICIQSTIQLSSSNVVDPDVVLVRERSGSDLDALPLPEDVLLLIEVAGSSLTRDQQIKSRLYAESGIIEYWIIDIESNKIIVHREPADEQYKNVKTLTVKDTISPLNFPSKTITIKELLV